MSIDRRSRSRSASADQTANEASQAAITHDGDVTHVAPLSPPASLPPSVDTRTGPSTNDLIVDAMLLRFKNIIELATTNKGDVTSEVAASQAFQTNVETQALVCLLLSDSSRE
jgi:hypothetical protein